MRATHFSFHRLPHYHQPTGPQPKEQISSHIKPVHFWTEAPRRQNYSRPLALSSTCLGANSYSFFYTSAHAPQFLCEALPLTGKGGHLSFSPRKTVFDNYLWTEWLADYFLKTLQRPPSFHALTLVSSQFKSQNVNSLILYVTSYALCSKPPTGFHLAQRKSSLTRPARCSPPSCASAPSALSLAPSPCSFLDL